MRPHFLLLLSPFLLASACGGQVAGPLDGGLPADASHDAPAESTADTGPAVDCTKLASDIGKLEEAARTCCTFCNSVQCSHAVQGLCCPVSITADQAPELTQALAQFKQAGCVPSCPAVLCPDAPSNVCEPGQDPNGPGRCR